MHTSMPIYRSEYNENEQNDKISKYSKMGEYVIAIIKRTWKVSNTK